MIDLINAARLKNWDLEVEEVRNKTCQLRVLNDEVKQFELSDITSYKIKAIIDKKTVILKTEDITNIDEIFKCLEDNAELIDNIDENILAKESIEYSKGIRSDIDFNVVRNDLLNLYNYKKEYSNIVNVDSIFETQETIIRILNTEGVTLEDYLDSKIMYINVSLKEGGSVSDSSDYYLVKEYKHEELQKLFNSVLKDALNRLHEESIKSVKTNVIINNNCMFEILDSFKTMFHARDINKGISILSDKFNKTIFSPLVNIVEDPLNEMYPGRKSFDSEGTRCCFKKIVENGKFINKLYDNKEAIKDKVASTGNAGDVNNMYLDKGDYSFEEMIKELNEGIIITDLSGLHSGVNSITGDMSLDARGYLVEEGKITKPLNSILLSANLFEVLNNVKMIGNDLKFGSTSVGSPSILCENIMIVGEK